MLRLSPYISRAITFHLKSRRDLTNMSFGGYYYPPLDRPLVSTRQAWGVPSGVRASHGRYRSPRRQPHFPPIMAVGPSARFLAAGARPGPAGYRREGRGQFATCTANDATAYRPVCRLAAFRYPLQSARRGFNAPLDAAEREEALAPSIVAPLIYGKAIYALNLPKTLFGHPRGHIKKPSKKNKLFFVWGRLMYRF